MKISLIFAQGSNGAFGLRNKLPWRIPEDMRFFSKKTRGHGVFMGHKTFTGLPPGFRPLPDRANYVLTRNFNLRDDPLRNLYYVSTFDEAFEDAHHSKQKEIFIIGGSGVIENYQNVATEAWITQVDYNGDFDVKAPTLAGWKLAETVAADPVALLQASHPYRFERYVLS